MKPDGKPLHNVLLTIAVRFAVGVVSFLVAVVAGRFVIGALQGEVPWMVAVVGGVLLIPAILASLAVFSLRAVYSSETGIYYRQDGAWQSVPWDDLQVYKRPWWAFNPAFPVVEIRLVNSGPVLRFITSAKGREEIQNRHI